jgi:thymidylate synthase (FAD)
MKVQLVSHTTPCLDDLGDDSDITDLIAFCARVSNPSNQLNTETTDKLIAYLLKHKHFSPFEMANICLEIETTRDIARQILRHRSFTFQEFSQRYADPVKDLSFEMREPRLQDTKNRQNSIEVDDARLEDAWYNKQMGVIEMAKMTYEWAIANGIAKEVARAVLPEGLTTSRLYVNGTIRSWIHYIEIRSDVATQKEHREIAIACATAISKIFPLINNFAQK